MTDINTKIYKMLITGYTLNEISSTLKLTPKQIHKRIISMKNEGYLLTPKIYDDGEIKYIQNFFFTNRNTNTLDLTLTHQNFKAMLISDLHIGNELQNLNYLNQIYDLCLKENIHIIINAGDFIDGPSSKGKQIIPDIDKQIEFAIKNHPFDKNIINLICFGNHDFDALQKNGRCVKNALENNRPDFYGIGYGLGILNIANDQIIVKHKINGLPFNQIHNKLILCGHKHKAGVINTGDTILLNIPPLSDLCFNEKQKYPGAIIMNLTIDENGFIKSGEFQQLLINSQIYTVNESTIDFLFTQSTLTEEEIKLPPKQKVLNPGSSQIEKFNKRYNR